MMTAPAFNVGFFLIVFVSGAGMIIVIFTENDTAGPLRRLLGACPRSLSEQEFEAILTRNQTTAVSLKDIHASGSADGCFLQVLIQTYFLLDSPIVFGGKRTNRIHPYKYPLYTFFVFIYTIYSDMFSSYMYHLCIHI